MSIEHRRPPLWTGTTRRSILKGGLLAGAGLLASPWIGGTSKAASPSLEKYVDPLPVPAVARPSSLDNGIAHYVVPISQFERKVHRDLPPTTLWGYDGTWPGPTLEARRGNPTHVMWVNNLPVQHLLEYAYDQTLHGADMGEPRVRTVAHLHGASTLPDSDGYPEAWFTRDWVQTGPFFTSRTYQYPNDQPATCLWYHDHTLGINRLNVFAGLAGFYIIRDENEERLNLPAGPYEVPLLIQDRMFNPDGSLRYPIELDGTHQVWVPEFFGDVACVNGVAFPYLEVEPRKYRFRILNGSNARFYHLTLADAEGQPGPLFDQIGTDGGLLPAPVQLTDLLIAPSERFDVVIDFSGAQGRAFTLFNDAPAPYPGGGEVALPEVMQFRVTRPLQGSDSSSLPSRLAPVSVLAPESAVRERFIMVSEADRVSDGYPIIGLAGGSPLQATPTNPTGGARWDDPVTEDPRAGTTEIWNFVNITTDGHPMHVHLVQFNVLERRYFDLSHYLNTGEVLFTGDPIPPAPNESPAYKDTVKAFSGLDQNGNVIGMVTRVIARFDLPAGTAVTPGQRFRYIYHCHILEHEDNEMMRPFDVVG
ncbi:MAG TPA: multicopper oxidase [Burkholderiaceae bacterium]|nr:multicopper oxidase [Burkholderiaceae bacterium]